MSHVEIDYALQSYHMSLRMDGSSQSTLSIFVASAFSLAQSRNATGLSNGEVCHFGIVLRRHQRMTRSNPRVRCRKVRGSNARSRGGYNSRSPAKRQENTTHPVIPTTSVLKLPRTGAIVRALVAQLDGVPAQDRDASVDACRTVRYTFESDPTTSMRSLSRERSRA